MSDAAYNLLTSAMRYWFVILLLVIFLRVAFGAYREYRLESPASDSGWGMWVWLSPQGQFRKKDAREQTLWVPVARRVRFGRGQGNDLLLPDPAVSLYQAQVYSSGKRLFVEDLGSRNGTYVNDALIRRPTRLRPGDVITMGEQTMRVEYEGGEGV